MQAWQPSLLLWGDPRQDRESEEPWGTGLTELGEQPAFPQGLKKNGEEKKMYSCSKTLGHSFFCQVVFNCFHRDVTEVHGGLASP